MSKQGQYVLKLAVLGDAGVGKTSLVNQFVSASFKEDYRATLGVNIVMKNIELEQINANARLILWDIAGQEQYEITRGAYYEGCLGALLVYDITRYSSFENIEIKWLTDYKKYVEKTGSLILIGNKNDLEDQRYVFKEDSKEMAKRINAIEFIETSAKKGNNVEKAFLNLVYEILGDH
ncbi:MAG: GTP-binding protein [Promethearchaeota archaeon]|nr:MAG: GTP-binding protein [Candidatus Lokiarchaeota archaeon]